MFGAVSALEGATVLAGTLGAGYLSRFAGIVPVLAIQGGGYVAAGLAMLVWLSASAGPPRSWCTGSETDALDGIEQALAGLTDWQGRAASICCQSGLSSKWRAGCAAGWRQIAEAAKRAVPP
ncbi:MAG TPA: hypothetical protein VFS62_17470 [Chloroflexota bacterium]|nr:hypothetical protein [Chloroflexota bacterium]